MSHFIIKKRANGEYHFNLKAPNGATILTSEGYVAKAACQRGIDSVKANASIDSRYDRLTSSNHKYYFNLKATNGQVIGTSELYESSTNRDEGIQAVKRYAPSATIEDQSV